MSLAVDVIRTGVAAGGLVAVVTAAAGGLADSDDPVRGAIDGVKRFGLVTAFVASAAMGGKLLTANIDGQMDQLNDPAENSWQYEPM